MIDSAYSWIYPMELLLALTDCIIMKHCDLLDKNIRMTSPARNYVKKLLVIYKLII